MSKSQHPGLDSITRGLRKIWTQLSQMHHQGTLALYYFQCDAGMIYCAV